MMKQQIQIIIDIRKLHSFINKSQNAALKFIFINQLYEIELSTEVQLSPDKHL